MSGSATRSGSPRPDRHWFEAIARHAGPAYLRYSFTKGTEQEVDFLVGALGLGPGDRVLDVGCGPGRHAHALARRGIEVVGVDIAEDFVELARADAPAGATFVCGDARELAYDEAFDAAVSLCQGGFGLLDDVGDADAVLGMARALRPGGRLALTAFSAYFAVRHLDEGDTFDVARGTNHERARVRDPDGVEAEFDLWTSCYTARELRLLLASVGLSVRDIWSVGPGRYAARPPDLEYPELLAIAVRDG